MEKEKVVHLTFDCPVELHKKLKKAATKERLSMRKYLMKILNIFLDEGIEQVVIGKKSEVFQKTKREVFQNFGDLLKELADE